MITPFNKEIETQTDSTSRSKLRSDTGALSGLDGALGWLETLGGGSQELLGVHQTLWEARKPHVVSSLKRHRVSLVTSQPGHPGVSRGSVC